MIQLQLEGGPQRALKVLCLGCHSDDIEIGCGGAVMRLAEQYPNCEFHWVVFNAIGAREAEARQAAGLFAGPRLRGPLLHKFRDGFMPYVGEEVKAIFEELKSISPDLVFTHYGKDAHQDHRLISELTWNTFRNHLILEYEIPKYDGDMGRPNVYIPLTAEMSQKKARGIFQSFVSQHSKQWFDETTFLSLMRLRGMECNADSGYAEAFYSRKLVL